MREIVFEYILLNICEDMFSASYMVLVDILFNLICCEAVPFSLQNSS
jgi:hypothetical protein